VSDESQRTYTAREIVLEFFPATHERLVPSTSEFELERVPDGNLVLRQKELKRELVLTPVARAGNSTTHVCCDLCQRSAPRHRFQMFRFVLPNSDGRRFQYVSLCADSEGCTARRISDEPLRLLMARAFES
jgi:hypothetical protein